MNTKLKIRTKVEDDSFLSDEELAWKLHAELNTGSPTLRTRSSRSRERSNLGGEVVAEVAGDKKHANGIDGIDEREGTGGKAGKVEKTSGNGEKRGKKRGEKRASKEEKEGRFGGLQNEDAVEVRPEHGMGIHEDKKRVNHEGARGRRGKDSGRKHKQGAVGDGVPRRSPRALDADEIERRSRKDTSKDVGRGVSRNRSASKGHAVESQALGRQGENDDRGDGNRPLVKKGRSRKGKPSVAAGGAVQERWQAGSKKRGRNVGNIGGKRPAPKIPKLPMVKEGDHWYRTRVLKETDRRIHVEFAGYEHSMPARWLPKYSERVWLGSYKGKDWRYHGDGAWIPKNGVHNKIITVEDYDVHEGAVAHDGGDGQDRSRGEEPRSNNKSLGTRDDHNEDEVSPSADVVSGEEGEEGINDASAEAGTRLAGEGRQNLEDVEPSDQKASQFPNGVKNVHSNSNSEDEAKVKSTAGGRKAGRSRKRGASTESSKKHSEEDSGGLAKRHRPKRTTKKTALFNNADFSLDLDADSEGTNGNNLVESEATNQSSRRNLAYGINLNTLDDEEQAALAALAEMPSSPACRFVDERSEAMLEDSREALLEAYTNGKGYLNGTGRPNGHGNHLHQKSKLSSVGGAKRHWKRSFRSEPNLRRTSHTSESIVVAGKVFGGLMHAISSRIGNGIHRTVSFPSTSRVAAPVGQSPRGWSPHVWSSGVTPANAEPAIVQVPTSLIEKALASPRHRQNHAEGRSPPVPLFY